MSYARNLLSRGEEIVFETRQHWFAVLAQVWLFVVLAVLALAVLIWQSTSAGWQGTGFLQIVAVVVLLGSLARIGLVVWGWQNQEYLVTTRRIIKAEGVLNKAMTDSSLEKINDAHLSQSWLGRIFRYGHLDIMTASDEPGADVGDAGTPGRAAGRDLRPGARAADRSGGACDSGLPPTAARAPGAAPGDRARQRAG